MAPRKTRHSRIKGVCKHRGVARTPSVAQLQVKHSVGKVKIDKRSGFSRTGSHDDRANIVLPDHAPEGIDGGWQGRLRDDEVPTAKS